MKNTIQQPLKRKSTGPNYQSVKVHMPLNELDKSQ